MKLYYSLNHMYVNYEIKTRKVLGGNLEKISNYNLRKNNIEPYTLDNIQ